MNQKREPRSDAIPKTESPAVSAQLDEIERRLKATRPQAVHLNLVALQRAAESGPSVELPRARKSHSGWVIAASWVCGAAVGALVMFVLTSLADPQDPMNHRVVHTERDAPDSIERDRVNDISTDPPTLVNANSDKSAAPVFVGTFDPLGASDLTFSTDGPTLHVGTHLRRAAENATWPMGLPLQLDQATVGSYEFEPAETRKRATFGRQPQAPISRREMMQEFLERRSAAAKTLAMIHQHVPPSERE